MAETQQTIDNTAAIKAIQDNAKKVSQLPPLTSLVNLQDKIAMEVGATGQTVYTTIEQLKDGGVGSQVVKHPVGISFDFPLNNKTDLDSIHGAFLIPGSLSGQVLNSGQNITGSAGISKVMILALAGTVSTGSLTISGTSVDRNTSVETPGDTEIIALDGLSTDNSTTDANGNPVYNYINNYISNKWWKGTLTFSTTDLDFTDIKFAQVAFEQFGDLGELTLDSLDATYKINNDSAEMDSYMYAVEVTSGNKANLTMVAELHHATGEFVDAAYRRRVGNINRDLNALTDGVFIDLWLAPSTQAYFSSFSIKVWGTKNETINIVVDGSLGLDSIIYGENLTNGTLVYLNADGKYYKADNTAESTSTTELRLILEDGLLDDEKLALSKGQYTTTSLTAGLEYVGTNGTITNSRPTLETETVRIVSTAINATTRYFDASKTWINGTASKINGVTIPTGEKDEFFDNLFTLINSSDQTRKIKFNLDGVPSGTTLSLESPTENGKIALVSDIINNGLYLGYFPTEADLIAFKPIGEPGNSAVIGTTDTIWVWDTDTLAWVDSGNSSSGLTPRDGVGFVLDLSNFAGIYYNIPGASGSPTYTTENETLGGFARCLINRAVEPTVTGGTKIKGSDYIPSTNMYMTVWYNGDRVEYWFEEI